MSTAKTILTPIVAIFKTEDRAITSLIMLVFVLAAAHNYDALRHFAAASGVASGLSFTTPILIDTFIGAAVWVSLRNKRYGERARLAWAIVILFTLASVWINLMHYPLIPGGITLAILVPVVVFLSAELAKGLVESQRIRSGQTTATAQLAEQAAQLAATIAAETASLAQLKQRKAQLEAQVAQHLEEARTVTADPFTREMYQIDGLLAAGKTQKEAAQMVGISESTLRNRIKNLNGDSLLHREQVNR